MIDGSTVCLGFAQFGLGYDGIDETTPDIDGGSFLSGAVGATASSNGYGAWGTSTFAHVGLNGYGIPYTVGGKYEKLNDLRDIGGNSAVKFRTIGNRNRLDFLIKNQATNADFILDSIHFDMLVSNNANDIFTIQYLVDNNGLGSLYNMGTERDVSPGTDITIPTHTPIGAAHHDYSISAELPGGNAGVKLAAGEQASFRITLTGSNSNYALTLLDNLAISGVFACD